MNSTDNSLQSLILLPVIAALVGVIMLWGFSLLPPHQQTEQSFTNTQTSRGGGDSARSFYISQPEGEVVSFAL